MAVAVAAPRVPSAARVYIGALIAAGGACVAFRLAGLAQSPAVVWQAALIAAAVVAADQFKLTLEHGDEREHFTLTDAVWLCGVMLAAPGAPTLGAVAGAVVWQVVARVPLRKLLFNAAQVALALTAAEAIWALGGVHDVASPAAWAVAVAAAAAAFVINQTSVALVVALVGGERFRDVWVLSLRFVLLQWLGNVSIGLLAVVAMDDHPAGLLLVAIPIGLLYLADREWVAGLAEREQMQDMARTAEAIARRPDPSARLPVDGREGRLLHLTASLNRMLEQLEQAFVRQRHVMGDAARILDGPVRGVRSELAHGAPTHAAVAHLDRAAHVLADMEAVAGVGEPAAVRPAPTPIAPLLGRVAADAEPVLRGRLMVAPVAEGAVARVDERWATRALLCLLENVAVHGRGNGPVVLRVLSNGRGWRFEVADHAGGIPVGRENAIFEPFYRAGDDAERPGLGLALVRSVAEAHGGSAGVVNRPGTGATFWLCVPR